MNELRGMAAGANVPFEEALMYTMEEEFSYLVPEALRYRLADHCSDVLILENDERFSFILYFNFKWFSPTTKTESTSTATAPSFCT